MYDDATALCHLGAREYDTRTRRWLSRDPALMDGGDPNAFAYANGDPINRTDPLGLADWQLPSINVAQAGQAALVSAGAATRWQGQWVRAYAAIIQSSSKVSVNFQDLYKASEGASTYGSVLQLHHLIPKYIGGPTNGLLVSIPAGYHQLITNAFRAERAYGQGKLGIDQMDEILGILLRVYTSIPAPLVGWR